MKRRSIKSLAAAICIAATTAGLSLAGAGPASASPVAPPTPWSSEQAFVVPDEGLPGSTSVYVTGWFTEAFEFDNIAAMGVYVTCDDIWNIPATISYSRYGSPESANFWVDIPISEVGHTCVLHGYAPAGRALTFSNTPSRTSDYKGQRVLMFETMTVVKSSNGGL